jgi:hypothetical protein
MAAGDRDKDSLGFRQIAAGGLAGAVGLTIDAGTEAVQVQPEAQNVRYRDDGVAPTATVGFTLFAGTLYTFSVAQAASMQFIQVAAGAILNYANYGARSHTRVNP